MIKANFKIMPSNPYIIFKALSVETERDIPKTKVHLEYDEKNLMINIESENISSMRAAINSYMRWITLIEDILGLIENG